MPTVTKSSMVRSRAAGARAREFDGTEMLQPMENYEESYLKPTDIFLFARQAAELLLSTHDYRISNRFRLKRIIDSCNGWEITDRRIERCSKHSLHFQVLQEPD